MKSEKSVGAIIFIKNEKIKYLLLHYESGHWDYVKGHVEGNETDKETLMREAKEETGLTDLKIIEGFREKIQYFFRHGGKTIKKEVVFLLAETNTEKIIISHEHKGYKWLPYEETHNLVTFKNAKEILEKADKLLNKKTVKDFIE